MWYKYPFLISIHIMIRVTSQVPSSHKLAAGLSCKKMRLIFTQNIVKPVKPTLATSIMPRIGCIFHALSQQ